MAEGYNIKIGVDSRSGEQGVKAFTTSLNQSLKALRDFDSRAGSTFKALDQFSKLSTGGLTKAIRNVTAGVEQLNKVKVNTRMVGNLQTLGRALNGIKFNGADSLKRLPDALKALDQIKFNPTLVKNLNDLKAATKGFTGPPKTLAKWPKALSGFSSVTISGSLSKNLDVLKGALKGFNGPPKSLASWPRVLAPLAAIKIPSSLASNVEAMKVAMRGFTGPTKSALNLPGFLRALSAAKISSTIATNLASLKGALAGFAGPSIASARNFQSLLNAMGTANVGQVQQVAAALAKLNGLSLNVGRTLNSAGRSGAQSMGGLHAAIAKTNAAMQQMTSHTHGIQSLMSMLQGAVGGLSIVGFAKSVYETGAAYQSLTRTLTSVATSTTEVGEHLKFLQDLTSRMPISLESAAQSYRKFAVAARLSGLSVQETQGIFENFSTGFSAMGLSADSQKYAFIALEQILSKGQVQMEELKSQLGDHLPGAVQILANAMGVPTDKLMKMIEAGKVGSAEIVKMGKAVKEQFGPAAEAAVNSTQGQFIALENAWTRFKKTIFDSGFDSALGAMANRLSKILDSKEAQQFASDIGAAFERAFRAISVAAEVLWENKEAVLAFFKAFAGYSIVVASVGALRLLSAPLMILGPLLGIVASGVGLLGTAFTALATGKALSGIKSIGTALTGLSGKIMAVAAGAILLAAALDAAFNDGRATKSLVDGVGSMITYMGTQFSTLGNTIGDTLTGAYEKAIGASEQFSDAQEKIGQSNLDVDALTKRNAEQEAKMLADKAKALSTEEQKLWDKINPIGEANKKYQDQLKLIDEIAKKNGMTDADRDAFKSNLAASTLEDRDPIGAGVRDFHKELAGMQALTAEQRALNEAKAWEQEMISKNVVATEEQWAKAKDAVAKYHLAVAKMQGEAGSGFERFAASVGDFNDNMQDAIKNGIGDLSSELADFVTGGEADFARLYQSILRTFAKHAIDGIFKDALGAMGMDGQKNGEKDANAALSTLGDLGKTISTQMTNVYTNGLSVNGVSLDGIKDAEFRPGLDENGNSMATKLFAEPAPTMKVEKGALENIPGTETTDKGIKLDLDKLYKTPKEATIGAGGVPSNTDAETFKKLNVAPLTLADDQKTVKIDESQFGTLRGSKDGPGTLNPHAPVELPKTPVDPVQTGALPAGYSYTQDAMKQAQEEAAKRAAAPATGSFGTLDLPQPNGNKDWLNQMYARGRAAGLPDVQARVMASQAALESRWGKSGLTKQANNFFGMKAGKSWTGETVTMPTKEQRPDGSVYWENAKFRKYGSMEEGLIDKEKMMERNWPQAMSADSWDEAMAGLKNGRHGAYATDIKYAQKLGSINKMIDPNAYSNAPSQTAPVPPQTVPPTTAPPAVDMMPTGSIQKVDTAGVTQLNTALAQTNTAAQTAAAPMQQMNTAVQQTSTTAVTSAQQTQMASTGLTSAATNAQMAGPQFQQAGVLIGQAGQSASTAGATAQTANSGLSSFGNGINSLLGPLSSVVPGLGQFGGAIMKFIGSLGGGGGMVGLFSEGGYSTAPAQTMRIPAFAEGTPNTSGGMPAILHPNEAVIPLSRGRKIGVELNGDSAPSRDARQENLDNRSRPVMVINLNGVKDADSFKRSKGQVTSAMMSAQQRASVRDG